MLRWLVKVNAFYAALACKSNTFYPGLACMCGMFGLFLLLRGCVEIVFGFDRCSTVKNLGANTSIRSAARDRGGLCVEGKGA